MADFNTHGGYFSPAGYMRINEGGTHEENPNGGVQVGVDPQGVPNMLEEGEPVYKDFVFSDNIKAQEQFLVEVGLPKRFSGKLYSEIVDELFAEAEERPNDPISRNGLDAMLSRVAQAQEAQKASEEEAQLMEEIQNMSPEEYAALEQAMMAQEQPIEQPMPGEEMVAPEQMVVAPEEQMQPEMLPMGYALGGRLFARGGDEDDLPYQPPLIFNPETGNAYVQGHAYAPAGEIAPAVVTAYGPNPVRDAIYKGQRAFLRGAGDIGMDVASIIPETAPLVAARDAYQAYRDFGEGNVWGGIAHSGLSLAGAAPLFPRLAGGLHRTGRGALRNATSHAKKVGEAANKSAQAVDATRAGMNASRNAVGDAYDKYIALLDKMDTITDAEQMTAAREEAESLLKELRSSRKDLHGDWFKLQGEKIAKLWNKTRRGVANVNESAWRGITGNKSSKATTQKAVEAGAEAASAANTAPTPASPGAPKVRRFWPNFLKTAGGMSLVGGGVAAFNHFFGDSDTTKNFDASNNNESPELVSFEDFINGFACGGVMNKFENGTRYGRTPDGQLVQIVDRTDGNGTTWQEYVPVQEAGNIDAANIVSLPQVNVTYNRPAASAPHAFMIPYGGGFGGGVRGGLSGNVYAVNSGTANGTAIGGGARGNMYDLGELSEAIVYPSATGTVSVGGMMPQAEVVGYRGSNNLPEAQVVGYRNPGQRSSSSGRLPAGPTIPTAGHLSDNELDTIINGRGNIPLLPGTDLPVGSASTTSGSLAGYNTWLGDRLKGIPATDVDSEVVVNDGRNGRPSVLSTLPRYAGAIGSGLLALNTLLQQPDHYEDTPIRPALPTGRILLQDQRYMPLDQNAITNQMQAQNTANARAILNSGAGPSTGALLAAADYTGGQNLGNALSNVWQANNQERNRVISANNQNAATRAQFYRDLNSQRAQILNNMAMYNHQNALRTAMLNNQAEQAKYNAFGQNLGNALQALSGIGQENFAMNQLNTNTALGWYVGPDGRAYYRGPNWNNCGGLLKKIKK